jgi:hypothetical protein
MQTSQYYTLTTSFLHNLHYVIFEVPTAVRMKLVYCDVTMLSASEKCSTSTSNIPANSNSCSSIIQLNSSFLKMGLNWPVFERYPVLKQDGRLQKWPGK